MKKTLILAIAALSFSTVKANANVQKQYTVVTNPNERFASGTVIEVTENGGKIMEHGTGIVRDFYHPGAQTQFIQGEAVVYILITLPNNRTIVNSIGKPPQ